MNYWIAFIYGIIQGITEFAPVSSSGHLALLPHLIKFTDPGVAFDLSMHVGTLLAVLIYFRREVSQLFLATTALVRLKVESFYLANMVISTVATVMVVIMVKGIAEGYARSPLFIVINLAVFGLIMWIADRFFIQDDNKDMSAKIMIKESLMIGIAQAFAVFPGVSRSGITLTISRMMNLTRVEASRFSFLLSAPIILAGFLYKLPAIYNGEVNFEIASCLWGAFISFVVGLATIHFFMRFIARIGLKYFAIYRFILAIVIVCLLLF